MSPYLICKLSRCDALQLADEAVLALITAGHGVDRAADFLGEGQLRYPVGRGVFNVNVSVIIKRNVSHNSVRV